MNFIIMLFAPFVFYFAVKHLSSMHFLLKALFSAFCCWMAGAVAGILPHFSIGVSFLALALVLGMIHYSAIWKSFTKPFYSLRGRKN